MHTSFLGALRPGRAPGLPRQHAKPLALRRGLVVKAAIEAPSKAAKLSERHLQLLQQHKGPLVKIATHYHVGFGDCLKVIGSSEELGAWKADDAPLMRWNEGDVWTLVTPLPPGEHEFKVVVQQASGSLIWEAGDHNRMVTVPEDAPVGSMVCSVCAFNIIDDSTESKVQPVTADVLALLDAQLEEEAAAKEEKLAAVAEAAAVKAEQSRVGQAAAAVAKALATMDAEAEESGVRPRTMSDSDTEDAVPEVTTPPRSRAGPAVVAAAATEAPAPSSAQRQEKQEAEAVADAATAADAQKLEAACVSSGSASEEQEKQEEVVVVHAEEKMEANLESMSQEVHPDEQLLAPSTRAQSAAAVHAKFAQGKAVAVGFVDKPFPAAPTNSVVAAFMKSVGGKGLGAAAVPTQTEPAAAAATAAVATPEPVAAAATAAVAAATLAVAKPAPATDSADSGAAAEPVKQAAPVKAAAAAAIEAPAAPAASPVAAPGPFPKGWGPDASASLFPARASSVSTSVSILSTSTRAAPSQGNAGVLVSSAGNAGSFSSSAFGSSMVTASAGTPPNSPKRHNRPPSPGRGSSHVVSAAAAAAVAADWIANVRNSNVVSASREAEKAASELAARLEAVQLKKSEAAAEAQRLEESLKSSSMVKDVAAPGSGNGDGEGYSGGLAAVVAAPSTRGFMAAARSKVREMTGAASSDSNNSAPLSPPPITPVGGSAAFAVSAPTAGGPTPPPVVGAPAGSAGRNVSTQAVAVNGGSSGGAGALAASGAFSAASADAEALEQAQEGAAGGGDGWSEGMQMLAAVVGCAAVGTVLWSEFVLKDTGCGLPPGPYGLMGAAEGLSYLTVLGFAGAGVGARVNSGGKQGLKGALAIPETLAYGALAAGLMVLASQLYEYGYIPPPLPGGQCFADSAVAMPGAEDLNNQLGAQVAALQAIMSQLQSAAVDGINKLQLQEQLAVLQAQVDAFSGYVSAQTAVVDAQVSLGLLELQDSLLNATTAVSSFVDTQLHQLDVSGKLAYVLDILRSQEQQLKVELPKQLAELQQLAATSMAVVQETALHASGSAHLPELLSSLDQVMAMLHGVLETRISQLDVVLTQLQGSIGAAAGQLAAAVAAAEQSGSQEAAGQLQGLQVLLSDAMSDVQAQVWAGYQQLALADKLSDMLLTVRTSAAAVAGSTAAEVDKLRLQEQLQQLEGLAEASAAALAANAMDGFHSLQLEERLSDIATQASAAAASLQAGLQQQYEQQLPAVEAQVASLQASLAGLAAKTEQQLGAGGPDLQLETLLRQLQQSMEGTMRLVGEVASSGVTAAGDAVQNAGGAASSGLTAVSQQLGAATDAVGDAVSATLASSIQEQTTVSSTAVDAAAPLAAAVQDPAVIRTAAVDMTAPFVAALQDSTPAVDAAMMTSAPAVAAPGFVVGDGSAVAAAYAEAVEAGLDFSTLVAYALQDHKEVLEALPNPDIYNVGEVDGVNLSGNLRDASDTIKSIWFNRPQ